MLHLLQINPRMSMVPSPLVDLVWHSHILDTKAYFNDCLQMFGKYIHHVPSFGEAETEKERLHEGFEEMMTRYREVYQVDPPADVWEPSTTKRAVQGGCCNGVGDGCAGCSGMCDFPHQPCPWCGDYLPHT